MAADTADRDGGAVWIGGAPGSGKTTAARTLTRRHGLRWYNSDAHTWQHRDRALAAGHPAAARFEAMTFAERAALPPAERHALDLRAERGPMAVDDVRALPPAPLTVAEGTLVRPAMLPPGAAGRAVFLTLTPEEQRARLEARHGAGQAPELYLYLGRLIAAELAEAGETIVRVPVDGLTPEETVAAVEKALAAPLAAGPAAADRAERAALLRYANRAVTEQIRGFCARPWSPLELADAETDFSCECGDPECGADVHAKVVDYPAAGGPPLLAPGH